MTDPILSEEQAKRLWERAARIQAEAEAARREEERRKAQAAAEGGVPDKLLPGEVDEGGGYSLTHVRQAGEEAGIQPEFLELALAEETVLELEGGSQEGRYDRAVKRLLRDDRRALEIRRSFAFPSRTVWLSLEHALISEPNSFDLLDIRGGEPAQGGVAIFEAPYGYQSDGSLKYYSAAADTKRYLVRVMPDESGEGCEVLVRVPLRRSRRIHGGVGIGLLTGFGVLGGLGGLGIAGLVGVTGGVVALPLAALLTGGALGGAAVGGGSTRELWNVAYRYFCRKLEEAVQKVLVRVERDLEREGELRRLPESGDSPVS
jgi:hypothetical protein